MKILTAEDIEAAARKYCELMGIDPEEHVMTPCLIGNAWKPQWQVVAAKVESFRAMQQVTKDFL